MKKIIYTLAIATAVFTLFSCASKQIPTDLTSAQLIQKAQNAYEKADLKGAIKYYETLIQRYGTDLSIYVEGQYELGHLYLRSHKYEKAYSYFQEILDIYEDSYYGDLPTAYKKLAEIGISQIPEKKLENAKADYKSAKNNQESTEE